MRVEEDAAEQKMSPANLTSSGGGRTRDEEVSMTIDTLSSLVLPNSLGVQDRESFRGLRCAVLKSRNNDLAWVMDWAKYHVIVHGLEGLIFFDNGSDRYAVEDVSRTLLEVDILQTVRVLSAPSTNRASFWKETDHGHIKRPVFSDHGAHSKSTRPEVGPYSTPRLRHKHT